MNDLQVPLDLVLPDYVIYDYTGGIYKIIHNKRTAPRLVLDRDKFQHHESKLDSSISRAKRSILELALCNEWSYFCTFTLNKDLFDRSNLDVWHKSFSQWIRDQRKLYSKNNLDIDIRFLLIPELHSDGRSWHMHGLFSDLSPVLTSFKDVDYAVPTKLIEGDFYSWEDYRKKFGFCSFGKLRDPVAASFYVTKYITKSFMADVLSTGAHTYYASRPLKRASKHGEVYGHNSYLDSFLTNHYEFCSTGFTRSSDSLSWDFSLEFMDFVPFNPILHIDDSSTFDDTDTILQLSLF